jgi:hypothetical protein
MRHMGLKNPMGVARICAQLESNLESLGYTLLVSSDMSALNSVVRRARARSVAPMHNADVCDFNNERAFWMGLEDNVGQIMGLQAFRCDFIETSLADWCAPYMIGVYMRCQELMVPSVSRTSRDSVANRLKGSLVYHGELWVGKQTRNRRVFEDFTRLGLLLTMIKWNPDAIWALAGEQMAKHGHLGRIGYTSVERGFLRWEWASDGVEPVEYLAVAERSGLEQLIDDALSTADLYPPAQTGIRYSLLDGR